MFLQWTISIELRACILFIFISSVHHKLWCLSCVHTQWKLAEPLNKREKEHIIHSIHFSFLNWGCVLPENILWRNNLSETKWLCDPRGAKQWTRFPISSARRQLITVCFFMRRKFSITSQFGNMSRSSGNHLFSFTKSVFVKRLINDFRFLCWWFLTSMRW